MYVAHQEEAIQAKLVCRSFKRRELLPVSQKLLWRIETGMVRTFSLHEDGSITTMGLWGSGDIVGYPLAGIDPYHIECLSDLQAHQLQDSRASEQAMLSHLYQSQAMMMIRHGSMRERLDKFLVWLADKFGEQSEQGYHILIQLTHQDIAEAIDTSRVTVTRLIGKLEKKEAMSWSRKSCLLHPNFYSSVKSSQVESSLSGDSSAFVKNRCA